MPGLLPDGRREVICVVNHPTEGALNWEAELKALKTQIVEQIDLIISDARVLNELLFARLSLMQPISYMLSISNDKPLMTCQRGIKLR